MFSFRFPTFRQLDTVDCGPTCLRMIVSHYGQKYTLEQLREQCLINREGVSLLGMSRAAEAIGMRSLAVQIPLTKLDQVPLPCIAHWRQNHFVVIHKVKRNTVYIADPAYGLLTYSRQAFARGWTNSGANDMNEGVLLLLEPTPDFYGRKEGKGGIKTGFRYLTPYLVSFAGPLGWLFLLLALGSLLQIGVPLLTQLMVDRGIQNQDINFIYLILLAQLALYTGRAVADFMRSWIALKTGLRMSISIISDFLLKLMGLPLSFFNSRMIGDTLQRISDHHRIERFLTQTIPLILLTLTNLVIFGVVLAIYNRLIFLIFCVSSLIYAVWVFIFIKKRRELDYKRFSQLSENQSNLIQLITGMQEIKLNACEQQKRQAWELIQQELFNISLKSLQLERYQQGGALFINELKNIILSFIVAKAVIEGKLTLGMMLAVQYIIGQLGGSISQFVTYIQETQDAYISLDRIGEIHKLKEEDADAPEDTILPTRKSLTIHNLSFRYAGPNPTDVLQNVNITIPAGKVTAIVGTSGSGKSTLLKLLLKFYNPTEGSILAGDTNLSQINSRAWRREIGVVMQDGYIFSDSIIQNIALSDNEVDIEKAMQAAHMANIQEFIASLPLGFDTKIGDEGLELSRGQKQRILIARAIYKDPAYIFFDEATNALDASNEKRITENLEYFYKGRTVVIVAHRLSTVQHADQIVVLDKGRIIEQGTHVELVRLRGAYYTLVKDQLELTG